MMRNHTKHKAGKNKNKLPGPLPQILDWADGKLLQNLLKKG